MTWGWVCWLVAAVGGFLTGWGLYAILHRQRRQVADAESQARVSRAQSDLDAALARADGLARERDDLRGGMAKLERETAFIRQRAAELEPLAGLRSERDALQRKLGEAEARVASLAGEVRAADEQAAKLKADLGALASRPAEVRTIEKPVDRVVEKIVEKRVEVPVEKIVEKRVEVPVERVVEKRIEVPVERIVYRDRAKRRAAARKPARLRRTRRPDDLKLIYGVGPVLEKFLNKRGVYWFRQVARWSKKDIERFEAALPNFQGRIAREGWVRSARQEHIKKYRRDPLAPKVPPAGAS